MSWRTARFTNDEGSAKNLVSRAMLRIADRSDEILGSPLAQVGDGHMDRRKRRRHVTGNRNVIEPRDSEVIGHSRTGFAKRTQGSNRHRIVRRENRSRTTRPIGEHLPYRFVA